MFSCRDFTKKKSQQYILYSSQPVLIFLTCALLKWHDLYYQVSPGYRGHHQTTLLLKWHLPELVTCMKKFTYFTDIIYQTTILTCFLYLQNTRNSVKTMPMPYVFQLKIRKWNSSRRGRTGQLRCLAGEARTHTDGCLLVVGANSCAAKNGGRVACLRETCSSSNSSQWTRWWLPWRSVSFPEKIPSFYFLIQNDGSQLAPACSSCLARWNQAMANLMDQINIIKPSWELCVLVFMCVSESEEWILKKKKKNHRNACKIFNLSKICIMHHASVYGILLLCWYHMVSCYFCHLEEVYLSKCPLSTNRDRIQVAWPGFPWTKSHLSPSLLLLAMLMHFWTTHTLPLINSHKN